MPIFKLDAILHYPQKQKDSIINDIQEDNRETNYFHNDTFFIRFLWTRFGYTKTTK